MLPPASRDLLTRTFPDLDVHVIGGRALELQGFLGHRATEDLDLLVPLSPSDLEVRLGSSVGWSRGGPFAWEHELRSFDLVPASPASVERGFVTVDGYRYDLRGVPTARLRAVGDRIQIVDPLGVVLLKMVSFLDRPPDRGRDLTDIAFVLASWLPADDPRRFDEDLLDRSLFDDRASAFVAGVDLGSTTVPRDRGVVVDFLSRLLNPDRGHDLHRMARASRGIGDVDAMERRLRAFQAGFERKAPHI